MGNFINLHAHSFNSDGHCSILTMARKCKELGFTACVITDHIYGSIGTDNSYCQLESFKGFELSCAEAKRAEDSVGIPVILGAECTITGHDEVCVFGRDAIRAIFEFRRVYNELTLPFYRSLRKNYDCAINLCHPDHYCRPDLRLEIADLLDGYEHIHMALRTLPQGEPPEFQGLVRLCNSDAHNTTVLEWCWNETEEPITAEDQLVRYLRERRPVRHFIMDEMVQDDDTDVDGADTGAAAHNGLTA